MTDTLSNVQSVLSNPVLRQSLKIIAPEVSIALEIVNSLFLKQEPIASDVLRIIDLRLADLLKQLTITKSELLRSELEIRIHELLGILNAWNKI